MEIPFISLKKYDGQLIPRPQEDLAAQGSEQGIRRIAGQDAPSWAAGATEEIFHARNDALQQVYKLAYPDINGLGNSIYRLDGAHIRFCLKVLGDAEGNQRETAVWDVLGYGEAAAGRGVPFQQIKGLPPAKFTFVDKQLRTVLTPYYPGVLKAISGGAYEFPLVICAALYVEEALAGLHARGLAYMDLCPGNILFKTTPDGAMLFFLTDMGGVKPLAAFAYRPEMADLLALMVPRRWTRREVLPPADLFAPHSEDPRLEPGTAYDFYTLGRTCMLLLGMGPEATPGAMPHLTEELCVEDLMRPTRAEASRFFEITAPWFSGREQDAAVRAEVCEGLRMLFCAFFQSRAAFVDAYLSGPLQARGSAQLQARLNRYRMALPAQRYQAFREGLFTVAATTDDGPFLRECRHLEQLVDALKGDAYEEALSELEALSQTRLVRVCRVANYALFHHKKVIRALYGGRAGLQARLAAVGTDLVQARPMAEEPEAAVCKHARTEGPGLPLGVLRRAV